MTDKPELYREEAFQEMVKRFAAGEATREDLLEFDGDSLWFSGGIKSVPYGTEALAQLTTSLLDTIGPSIIRSERQSFKQVGEAHAAILDDKLSDEQIGALFELLETAKYFTVQSVAINGDEDRAALSDIIAELGEDDTQITITVTDSLTTRGMDKIDRVTEYPSCVFEIAYIQGVLEEWTDRNCSVEETTCQAAGDDYCRWQYTLS